MRFLSYFTLLGLALAAAMLAPPAAIARSGPAAVQLAGAAGSNKAASSEQAVLERGRYLAIASDCGACHTVKHPSPGQPFAGGYLFTLPIGQIVSSNITPSIQFGIGSWSEEDFARAVRDGVAPGGVRLYPAMPYTDYSLMTNEDMHALYVYFMRGVAPVEAAPAQQTKMNFPFNMRAGVALWNMLFLNTTRYEPDPAVSAQINRGRYLVDGPAHCGTCHTPRNFMMAENRKQYLGGAVVGGWWAPNITPDPVGGIGGWSEQEIASYLRNGHVRDKSQANGPMAEAVEYSFRYLDKADLQAVAAYLKTIPPLPTKGQTEPAFTAHKPRETDLAQYEFVLPGSAAPVSSDSSTVNGALLYNTACAACHGVNGQGADDGSSPSLLRNRAVGVANADSLIMTVAYGLNRDGADRSYSMPGFLAGKNPIFDAMNEEQIAAVVNYVRDNFGNKNDTVSAADVKTVLAGGKLPFVIAYAGILMIAGAVIGLLIVFWLLRHFIMRRKLRGAKSARRVRHEHSGLNKELVRAAPHRHQRPESEISGETKAAPQKKPAAKPKK